MSKITIEQGRLSMRLDLEQQKLFGMEHWLKHWYRYGLCFNHYSRLLQKTAGFSPQALQAFQNARLQRLVHAAYREIPYYRDLFSTLKLKPDAIQTAADLKKLPYLTKELVVANFDKLISPQKRNFLCKVAKTSGTSGSPAQFIRSFNAINFENAAIWRQWKMAGDPGKRRITLRGEVVVPLSQSKPPFWRFNPANQELRMCGFHLNESTFDAYLQKIMAFQPQILSSYPSNAYALAKYFRQRKIAYRFDAVFTSSETLSPGIKRFIEDTFQTQVYDWYGQAERVAAIGHCHKGTYHIQEDYSLVELAPMDQTRDQTYEIVGTHLFNDVMPLIRYKTGDLVKINAQRACACGSHFRTVEAIDGRACDYILTPEGYRISAANHIFHGVENVLEGQLYQDNTEYLIIKVVASSGFTEQNRTELVRNARENTSDRIKIVVEEVDQIRRAPNGKFQSIVSRLPDSD
jgi:phenylacetate-CoA ligase